MNEETQAGVPAAFSRAQAKIEQWRQMHRPRARIPEELWSGAVALAGAYGVYRTAKALRLDYSALKRRSAAAAPSGVGSGAATSGEGFPFVEVLGGVPGGRTDQCLIEVEDGGGARMRIYLPGQEHPDLAALVRVFREGRG
jgi:hypothetical protein